MPRQLLALSLWLLAFLAKVEAVGPLGEELKAKSWQLKAAFKGFG
jgi:hypothetical protein